MLHKIDSVSRLLAFLVTEEKHSDPCSAESEESITYGGGKVSDRKYCFLQEIKYKVLSVI